MKFRIALALLAATAALPAASILAEEAAPPPAAPAEAPAPAAPAEPAAPAPGGLDPAKSAEAILKEAEAKWETIKDYTFRLRSWNRKGEEISLKVMDVWFKRPTMTKTLVIEGDNEGGVAVRDAKGVMRGHKGGMLSRIKLTLGEDDDRIRNLRGKKFYQSDWGTVLKEYREAIGKGWTLTRLPDEKIGGAGCFVLKIEGPAGADKVTRDLLWIDGRTMLLMRRRQFEGEVKVNDATYTNAKLNPGLEDSLFTM